MANRTTFSDLSPPPVPGDDFFAQYAERLKQLFDNSAIKLTAIGGTADAVTASLDPLLDGSGLVDGMKFTLTFGAANTGAMTLAINGGSALALQDPGGAALTAGAVASGLRALIEYIGGAFRLLTAQAAAAGGTPRYYQVFTASGTWTKPAGLDDDTMVTVECWGGGGSGSASVGGPGGGGGGYHRRMFRIADLAASITVTIGAGGAVGVNGGNTTFGSLMTAFGGGRGNGVQGGGGGGTALEPGGVSTSAAGGTGGKPGGGDGGSTTSGKGTDGIGGGGGGGSGPVGATGEEAGWAEDGGAGGSTTAAGGFSVRGGNGGATGVPGSAPGGGGGRNAAGARGEVRVWI